MTDPFAPSPKNPTRTKCRATAPRSFVGVDGEGVTHADGTHDYVLLSVGTESLHSSGAPLTFEEIAAFLWEQHLADPEAIMVGFYLTYDFTMWLKGLPEHRARMLLTVDGVSRRRRYKGKNPVPFPVYCGDWEFDLHAGKRFKLRPLGSKEPWAYVCDVGPFFQSSFLAAIDPANWPEPIVSAEEFALIRDGKLNRTSAQFDASMVRYNVLENDVLARVMMKLDSGFTDMRVRLGRTQWYGPGQAAQAWLNLIDAPTASDIAACTPVEVLEAAQASYYGGWFEIFHHGLLPGVTYEYDINSAYPAVIAKLPCLLHGEWRKDGEGDITLVRARVSQIAGNGSRIGTMPHRTHEGAILRPRNTMGWYWKHELEAAKRANSIDGVIIYGQWAYLPRCGHRPFSDVAGLYDQRRIAGKDTPLGRALKLVYNSVYGKLAQSVGDPKYANAIYASLVTAGCRTSIWNAIATHPGGTSAVAMIATDGVFFTSPHNKLPVSNLLGDWSAATRTNLSLFMPGLYWDDETRNKPEGKIRSRGIAARDLRGLIPRMDAGWRVWHGMVSGRKVKKKSKELWKIFNQVGGETADELKKMYLYRQTNWPLFPIPVSFGLITAKLAMHRNDWASAGTISTKPRVISADPSDKRDPHAFLDSEGRITTMPYDFPPGSLESTPYDKRFGLELQSKMTEEELITPDGHVLDELYEFAQDM